MIATFTWITTALCLTGTVLNVKKNALCFWLWSAGNIAWLCFDIATGTYSRALLDAVQLAFAIWGIFAWRKKK
jgi:nicotinamide riboside transporter PnuC